MTGKSILLADDSPTIRRVVELTLADRGVRLEAVGSGVEALSCLETLRPDLVLADVGMPAPAGHELCRRIKSSPRPVPVVLLSGHFERVDPDAARACGADAELTKPFDPRDLVAKVQALLEREPDAPARPPAPPANAQSEAAAAPPAADVEAIAAAVAQRLAGPLADEIARELDARGLEPRRG